MFHALPYGVLLHGEPSRILRPRTVILLLLSTVVISQKVAQSFEDAAASPIAATSQSSAVARNEPLAADRPPWQSLLEDQALPPASQSSEPASQKSKQNIHKTLGRWQLADQEEFAEHGKVSIQQGRLTMELGYPATGVRLKGPFPKSNYEIQLDAKRTDGGDFFCGLTFPVGDGSLTLILGGWGGWVVGLSCIDDMYAIDNETCTVVQFQQDRWYSMRLRVTESRIEVWIDDQQVIHLDTEGKELLISDRMDPCLPLGLATWNTTGVVRKIRYRLLTGKRDENSTDNRPIQQNKTSAEK